MIVAVKQRPVVLKHEVVVEGFDRYGTHFYGTHLKVDNFRLKSSIDSKALCLRTSSIKS
jgi:hypothetical protein